MTAMDDPATWPLGRVLPVVRRTDDLFPDLGLLVAGAGPVVYLLSLHEATPDRLASCGRDAFRGFDELPRCWRVD